MTTHSPYVLASLNNLIYAHKVGQVNKEAVESIIPSYSWIDFNDINVFFVADGGIESILDEYDMKIPDSKYETFGELVVEIYEAGKEKVTYVKMTAEKAAEVVEKHLKGGKVVTEYTIAANQ